MHAGSEERHITRSEFGVRTHDAALNCWMGMRASGDSLLKREWHGDPRTRKIAVRMVSLGAKFKLFRFRFIHYLQNIGLSLFSRISEYQISQSSFSSVSKPIFAPKYAFFSIFRDLQDFHTFAPLQFAKSVLNIVQIFAKFADFFANVHYFCSKSTFFAPILMKISRNFKFHALIFDNLEIQEIKR